MRMALMVNALRVFSEMYDMSGVNISMLVTSGLRLFVGFYLFIYFF